MHAYTCAHIYANFFSSLFYFSTSFTISKSEYSLQLQERVNSLCIVADDSVFLTLLVAHLSKTSHVISLFPGLRDKGAQYLQAVADANGFSMDHVEVLEKRKTCLTMHDTHQKKVIPS